MSDLSSRTLSLADMSHIEGVILSRDHYLSGSRADHGALVDAVGRRMADPETRVIGLFEGVDLDAFFEWRPIGPVPRADDPHKTEAGAVVVSQWSRRKPEGRTKLDGGYDVNSGHLLNAAIKSMDDAGFYTYWYLTPAAWAATPQRNNPLHAEMASKRIARIADPDGPYAAFVKRLSGRSSVTEALAAHVSTLKDEHR